MLILNEVLTKSEVREVQALLERLPFEKRQKMLAFQKTSRELLESGLKKRRKKRVAEATIIIRGMI